MILSRMVTGQKRNLKSATPMYFRLRNAPSDHQHTLCWLTLFCETKRNETKPGEIEQN